MSLLEEAISSLTIQCVRLRESQMTLHSDYDPDDIELSAYEIESFNRCHGVSQVGFENESGEQSFEYRFRYQVGIRLVPEESEEQEEHEEHEEHEEQEEHEEEAVPFAMIAVFSANYYSKDKLDEKVLIEFSKQNVGYHVWPYWRELVQSSAARVGIEGITIPFYRC